jgi:predicted DsbA family dithiol-disulfide isomerase
MARAQAGDLPGLLDGQLAIHVLIIGRHGQRFMRPASTFHKPDSGTFPEPMGDLTSAPIAPPRADDHVRGDPHGELVVMYADFTCPRCAKAALELREDPRIRLVFRHFALKAKHPRSVALACAAEAAALQDAFWPFHDALFADQGRIDDPHLWERCKELELDLDRFEQDRRSEVVAERVRRDVREGMRAGVTGTPALLRPSVD